MGTKVPVCSQAPKANHTQVEWGGLSLTGAQGEDPGLVQLKCIYRGMGCRAEMVTNALALCQPTSPWI